MPVLTLVAKADQSIIPAGRGTTGGTSGHLAGAAAQSRPQRRFVPIQLMPFEAGFLKPLLGQPKTSVTSIRFRHCKDLAFCSKSIPFSDGRSGSKQWHLRGICRFPQIAKSSVRSWMARLIRRLVAVEPSVRLLCLKNLFLPISSASRQSLWACCSGQAFAPAS